MSNSERNPNPFVPTTRRMVFYSPVTLENTNIVLKIYKETVMNASEGQNMVHENLSSRLLFISEQEDKRPVKGPVGIPLSHIEQQHLDSAYSYLAKFYGESKKFSHAEAVNQTLIRVRRQWERSEVRRHENARILPFRPREDVSQQDTIAEV